MNHPKGQLSDSNVSRRALLLGVGGGLASALLMSSEMASALVTNPTGTSSVNPDAVRTALDYLRSRANVKNGGFSGDLLKFFRPDAKGAIDFELTRFGELSMLGSANRWNGVIDSVASQPQIISAIQNGSSVSLLVKDWTAIKWRPAPPLVPVERSPEEWAFVRKDPVRYGLDTPSWTSTDSGFGTTHLLTLENDNGQWLITKDGYNEGILGGTSPDFSADLETRVASQAFLPSNSTSLKAKTQPRRLEVPNSANLTTHTFDYNAAMAYAIKWASSYNPAYQNWGSTNADCANFVSQSFIAGGYPTDGTWSAYTYAWVNNTGLRDWLINSGRGHDETASMLGLADCVNYDWTNDGTLDHIALVTSIPGSVPLVSCHSAWQLNVPYNAIYYSGYMPNQTRKYTGTWLYYPA